MWHIKVSFSKGGSLFRGEVSWGSVSYWSQRCQWLLLTEFVRGRMWRCWFALARMGWLDQMLCSCRSFSMICQQSPSGCEKYLRSGEYRVTSGRTVLELDVLVVCEEGCHKSGGGL